MQEWNLADAKNRFSELVNLAITKGPQKVRRRKDEVVVMSVKDYEKLQGKRRSFKEFLLQGPDFSELLLDRDQSEFRDIEL
jgi:prevent-host-death family protein